MTWPLAGMPPELAARLTALVEEYRPVLAEQGMEAVQRALAERRIGVIHAIVVTRELLRAEPITLHQAQELVLAARQ